MWRRWPYYLYVSTVATASLPAVTIWLSAPGYGQSWVALQVSLAVAALHLLVVAALLVTDRSRMTRQLRGISRVQFRKWPWCRGVCSLIYRDTDAWWRAVGMLVFVPCALFNLVFAYVI